MSRAPSVGTPALVCQAGFGYPAEQPATTQLLRPPPPLEVSTKLDRSRLLQFASGSELKPAIEPKTAFVHESFHVVSGIYPFAEACVVELSTGSQYISLFVKSAKSVPPTATLNGVDATPFTDSP